MSIEAINEGLLRAIGVGVAILAPDLTLKFGNAAFRDWFEAAERDAAIATITPGVDIAKMAADLGETGRHTVEISFRRKRRLLIVELTFTRTDLDLILLECQNVTRIRELETMIESYSAMVERNTKELQREKERVERLLLNIMPRNVYDEYKTFGVVTPQRYDSAGVLSLDFVDFDAMTEAIGPSVVISEVNDIYAAFDRIGEQFGCERIRTTGDAYVTICGVPDPVEDPTTAILNTAQRLIRYLSRRNSTHPNTWACRIGVAVGPVIGSVVGTQNYVYDVFGQTSKLADSLKEEAKPMEIVCAAEVSSIVRGEFQLEDIGECAIEGVGNLRLSRMFLATSFNGVE